LAHAGVTFHGKVDHTELRSSFIKTGDRKRDGNKYSHCWEHTRICS
jgi:hypothetical protein